MNKKLPFTDQDIKNVLDWAEQNLQECLECIGETDLSEDEQDEVYYLNSHMETVNKMRGCLGLFPSLVYSLLNEEMYQSSNLDEFDTRWKSIRNERKSLLEQIKKAME